METNCTNSLKFKTPTRDFSIITNEVIDNENLSVTARMLYITIARWINCPNYTLYKATLRKKLGVAKDTFDKYWNELKEAGYLVQHRLRNIKGQWSYEYELLETPAPSQEEIDRTPKNQYTDSPCTGKTPMSNKTNQRKTDKHNIYQSTQDRKDDIKTILDHCRKNKIKLSRLSIQKFLSKYAKDTIIETITRCIQTNNSIESPYAYISKALSNATITNIPSNVKPSKNAFNAFPQRDYDKQHFDTMELQLMDVSYFFK